MELTYEYLKEVLSDHFPKNTIRKLHNGLSSSYHSEKDRFDIETIDQLSKLTIEQFWSRRGVGKKVLNAAIMVLRINGLSFKNDQTFRKRFDEALPKMREAARELGYAITTHGSMDRDFDIVVIPWTEDAVDTKTVAHAIREAAGSDHWRCPHAIHGSPHGREWWPFDWPDSSHKNKDYVDMSIMPRKDINER